MLDYSFVLSNQNMELINWTAAFIWPSKWNWSKILYETYAVANGTANYLIPNNTNVLKLNYACRYLYGPLNPSSYL